MYGIASETGGELTAGIQTEAEAYRLAQEWANNRGEAVEVCEYDPEAGDAWPDGVLVEPADEA